MAAKRLRIGGASGFWGDAARATPQLLAAGDLDFIVYDYLAEITMSIMARARARDPALGFAVDFVHAAMKPNLAEIERQGVRIVSNAGGVNPSACAAALRSLIDEADLDLKVACVLGDDLQEQRDEFAARGVQEMFSGSPFPATEQVQSINAYLGAFPIARALELGADIVICGRCVDSAVTLAACVHHFGWSASDYDRLAMASLAGHILECGPQATGGNFTDWQLVADDIDRLGYPIAEIAADGTFQCSKPEDSGGLLSVGTIAEQLVYEIGDPQAYLLPDVSCDFSGVKIESLGPQQVRVSGARGHAPTDSCKVSATYTDGFRGGLLMSYYGIDAAAKAQAQAAAVFRAARRELQRVGLPDFLETSVEVLGAESQYGHFGAAKNAREVVLKVAARHPQPTGIGVLLKEAVGLGLATPPGLCGFQAGRPKPSPVVRLFSFLAPKKELKLSIEIEDRCEAFVATETTAVATVVPTRPPAPPAPTDLADGVTVPLINLAWGRSGDKGDKANIGIIARRPEYLPYIYAALTEAVVRERFAHFLAPDLSAGDVERFLLPGSNAINFLLHDVLGGGGIASLRNDPQGKGYAQLLLGMPIPVSAEIAASSLRTAKHHEAQARLIDEGGIESR